MNFIDELDLSRLRELPNVVRADVDTEGTIRIELWDMDMLPELLPHLDSGTRHNVDADVSVVEVDPLGLVDVEEHFNEADHPDAKLEIEILGLGTAVVIEAESTRNKVRLVLACPPDTTLPRRKPRS